MAFTWLLPIAHSKVSVSSREDKGLACPDRCSLHTCPLSAMALHLNSERDDIHAPAIILHLCHFGSPTIRHGPSGAASRLTGRPDLLPAPLPAGYLDNEE